MDIGALSIAMSQAYVHSQVGLALTKMSMDVGKDMATQMTEMMGNMAVDPDLGNHIDVRA